MIDYDQLVQKAMKELNISEKKAIAGLMIFMCGHGTIEDFKDFINYFIKKQHIYQ